MLPSLLTIMRNTWGCLDFIVDTCKSILFKITKKIHEMNTIGKQMQYRYKVLPIHSL